MLDEGTRQTILRLRDEGHAIRAIARTLRISRGAVKDVLAAGIAEVPRLERVEICAPYHDVIIEQYGRCKGNLVRVHEELVAAGAEISYQALTGYCRRHGIGTPPTEPAGEYHFEPGQEMQHDTSPHEVKIGGKVLRAQTASLVLCYSRMVFIQLYPHFTRFACKVFLTEAVQYFGGACHTCMIDNTHVVVLHGTGKQMVPVPEMEAFGDRFGFVFAAHEKGDANRSARVERRFHYIENNFLAGREFADWDDVNRQAIVWCEKVNATFRNYLRAAARELLATESTHLVPLPIHIPEVYDLHHRIVDLEGYVNVHGCRYSAPYKLIGRRLEVRETKDRIDLYDGPRLVGSHRRCYTPASRAFDPAHRPPRGQGTPPAGPQAEEREVVAAAPELADYVRELRTRSPGRGTTPLRRLARMLREYPRAAFLSATASAAQYGLYDLDRLERLILRNVGRDFFPNPYGNHDEDHDQHDD
jgi:hypothetical protein